MISINIYKIIDISKDIRAKLRHFKISFSLWDIFFIKNVLLLFINII